jgi:O-antigen ligase
MMSVLRAFNLSSQTEAAEPSRGWPSQREPSPDGGSMALSARGMTTELWLTLIYLVVIGIGDLQASKLGVTVGPVPLFLTDITLLLLFAASFVRWPSRVLYWLSEGFGAGSVGRAVWLLIVLAVVLFCLAVGEYPLYAARDLAIFAYSLFYPLVYFAIRDRRDALKLLRYFSYAGVIAAALLVAQETVGLDLGLFEPMTRVALGHTFVVLRGASSIFSLIYVSVYALFDDEMRLLHVACAILCAFSLAESVARAHVVGVFVAAGITLYCGRTKDRVRFLLGASVLALPVILAPFIPQNVPASRQLENLRVSVISAAGGPSVDGNAGFRTRRWEYAIALWAEHPFVGVGFGREIIPSGLVDPTERKGDFNVGMPHNSFLFILARTGVVGLALILYCWYSILSRLIATFQRTYNVEYLAVANILGAMFAAAMFGLFIERPASDASFWILLAIGARLVEC